MSYSYIESSFTVVRFGLLPWCAEQEPCLVQVESTISCSCCPNQRAILRGMSYHKFLRDCNILPFVGKTLLLLIFEVKQGWQGIIQPLLFSSHSHSLLYQEWQIQRGVQSSPSVWQPWVTRILSWQGHKLLCLKCVIDLYAATVQRSGEVQGYTLLLNSSQIRKKKNLITFLEVHKMKSLF